MTNEGVRSFGMKQRSINSAMVATDFFIKRKILKRLALDMRKGAVDWR
jgi:hypothetical protein